MQICLIHLDDAVALQTEFISVCNAYHAQQISLKDQGPFIRLWAKNSELEKIGSILKTAFNINYKEPRLCFIGSGDFHHVSALLISAALKTYPGPLTVIHFDNHPDWVTFHNGVHCGSWINQALKNPGVIKIITVGVCSNDLRNPDLKGANLNLLSQRLLEVFPYRKKKSRVRGHYGIGETFSQRKKFIQWQSILSIGEKKFIDKILLQIETKNVYITIDKDVLAKDDAVTNWDQGEMRLTYLQSLIEAIGSERDIVGADIIGDYSIPCYNGSLWQKFIKHTEVFFDQPWKKPKLTKALAINDSTNRMLLKTFQKVMK